MKMWKKTPRICENPNCKKEYYAMFQKQAFHNTECGQKARDQIRKEKKLERKHNKLNKIKHPEITNEFSDLSMDELTKIRDDSEEMIRYNIEKIVLHKKLLVQEQKRFHSVHSIVEHRDEESRMLVRLAKEESEKRGTEKHDWLK